MEINVIGEKMIKAKKIIVSENENGEKVLFSQQIAELHEMETKALNQLIKKNFDCFSASEVVNIISFGREQAREIASRIGITYTNATKHIYMINSIGYAKIANMMLTKANGFSNVVLNEYYEDEKIHVLEYHRKEVEFFNLLKPIIEGFGLSLEQQRTVLNYRLDGYIPELNLAVEFDEQAHQYKQQGDIQRQKEIKAVLNCDFVRVTDQIKTGEALSAVINAILELMAV